jgi:hypothetical protein
LTFSSSLAKSKGKGKGKSKGKGKGKGKGHRRTSHEGPEGEERYSSTLFLTSALDGVGGQRHVPPPALPPEEDPVPIVWEAGRTPGPVWKGTENLTHTGIRSPDRPARSGSLSNHDVASL